MNTLDVLNALADRGRRIQIENGYHTDAGLATFIGRTRFDGANEFFPLLSWGVPVSTPDRIVANTQTYTVDRQFVCVGYIATTTDDYASNPIALQDDIERAVLSSYTGDPLPALIEDLSWVSSLIDYPSEPNEFTRVAVTVRARYTERKGPTSP